MRKKTLLYLSLTLSLIISAFLGINSTQASYPSFTIHEVVKGESVTILTKDMPANLDFKVLMGEYNTKGVGGIESAVFNSGAGNSFSVTVEIPQVLSNRAMISIRIESLTGGYYYYNWFWNDAESGYWPEIDEPEEPPVNPPTDNVVPTFSIKSVDPGKSVTISAKDFPKNLEFAVLMGEMWTMAIDGIEVAKITSSDTGIFEATFDIPEDFKDHQRVSIRLESLQGGYYAYNWFWNVSSGVVVLPPITQAPVKYPHTFIMAVVKDESVTLRGYDFPKNTELTVLMGKMWTMGINGFEAGKFTTTDEDTFVASFIIPEELAGLSRISIRLTGGGFYAYNWFWNNTATIEE